MATIQVLGQHDHCQKPTTHFLPASSPEMPLPSSRGGAGFLHFAPQSNHGLPNQALANEAPDFLHKLCEILEVEDKGIIQWHRGQIQIQSSERLCNEILGKYFRHSKYTSFQRQLNYFGFRKRKGRGGAGCCVYENRQLAGHSSPQSLLSLCRRTSAAVSAAGTPAAPATSVALSPQHITTLGRAPWGVLVEGQNLALHIKSEDPPTGISALPPAITPPSSHHQQVGVSPSALCYKLESLVQQVPKASKLPKIVANYQPLILQERHTHGVQHSSATSARQLLASLQQDEQRQGEALQKRQEENKPMAEKEVAVYDQLLQLLQVDAPMLDVVDEMSILLDATFESESFGGKDHDMDVIMQTLQQEPNPNLVAHQNGDNGISDDPFQCENIWQDKGLLMALFDGESAHVAC